GADVYGFLASHPDVDVHAPDLCGQSARQLFEAHHASATTNTATSGLTAATTTSSTTSHGGVGSGSLNLSTLSQSSSSGMVFLDAANVASSSSSTSSMIMLSMSPDVTSSLNHRPNDDVMVISDAPTILDAAPKHGCCDVVQAVAAADMLGTFLQYDHTAVHDMEAFLWTGQLHVEKSDVLAFFRVHNQPKINHSFVSDAPSTHVQYARRVVLWCLDVWIQLLQETPSPPLDVCFDISNLVIHLLPAIVETDAVLLQWLTTRKIAPFVKACQTRQPFTSHGHCDAEYTALAAYFDQARPLAFLTDAAAALPTTTTSTGSVRDRLALAGVASSTETRTPVVAAKRRFSILDRVARLW
ncbi:hypothetical protein DYB28_014954, partial [Aphanomyces astaci]